MNQFAVFVLVLCTLGPLVSAFPSGAPAAACVTLSPNPAMHLADPQEESTLPYYLNFTKLVRLDSGVYGYKPGETYTSECSLKGALYIADSAWFSADCMLACFVVQKLLRTCGVYAIMKSFF